MGYLSVIEFAKKYGISERTARNYCAEGKIDGAFLTGKTWNIPEDAVLPKRKNGRKERVMPLLAVLREQKAMKMRGGIYHKTQIDLTYNSNHIEGSRLTHEQTRYIFETNTIGMTKEAVNVDDIVETVNHFRCIDLVIEQAEERLTERFIKELHATLKAGTSDGQKKWFAVGDYKQLPNEVGGNETCPPEEVHSSMKALLSAYNDKKQKSLEDILDFHVRFERIHPFQDGNGRVGRLILFKECLVNGIVPFIITDELKFFYYQGLREWGHVNGYLTDTCLTAQDRYKVSLDYYRIKH
jgi:Fic family protein